MEQKEVKIQIPEGYEIDEEKSTFEKIVFKAKVKQLPKSWEELKLINGYYINGESITLKYSNGLAHFHNKNVWPTKEYAEAALALSQLLQLRQVYNDGWEPDWSNNLIEKFCITLVENKITINVVYTYSAVLSFKSKELAMKFLTNFKNLIETAKPLL